MSLKKDSENRFDFAGFGKKVKFTPQGFAKIPAFVTRTGVFTYFKADGSKIRELRLPEEVFSESSLESLAGAPVTDLHPTEDGISIPVNPSNSKKLSVGFVNEQIKQDDRFVAATLTVTDQETIDMIKAGERKEISLGYSCSVEHTPGVYNGEKYDAIQRNIIYNHAAIGPENWGRAGNEVSFRMDSNGAMAHLDCSDVNVNEKKEANMENKTIKLDGVDFEAPEQTQQAFEKALGSKDATIEGLKKDIEGLNGRLDALKAELDNEKKAHTDAKDPKAFETAVNARVSLVSKATKLVGDELKADSMSDREIKEAVVAKYYPETKLDGKSDDYVNAFFDCASESFKDNTESMKETQEAIAEAVKEDSKEITLDSKKVDLSKLASEAWKKEIKE